MEAPRTESLAFASPLHGTLITEAGEVESRKLSEGSAALYAFLDLFVEALLHKESRMLEILLAPSLFAIDSILDPSHPPRLLFPSIRRERAIERLLAKQLKRFFFGQVSEIKVFALSTRFPHTLPEGLEANDILVSLPSEPVLMLLLRRRVEGFLVIGI
ncbi:MAG: hypothetical protein N2515_01310 [Deltaproteobacteria bacterium]|nr:hypothetical protein [Deltaproteobacteria bacterium]